MQFTRCNKKMGNMNQKLKRRRRHYRNYLYDLRSIVDGLDIKFDGIAVRSYR